MPFSISRVRVAISTPAKDQDVKDPGCFAIHVGHAQTMYLGSEIAKQRELPFDVRLDGSIAYCESDLSGFVLDIVGCLDFLGIKPRRVYWQRQTAYTEDELVMLFGSREASITRLVEWDKGAIDVNAIIDDIVYTPSVIVRGNEFVDPDQCVGRRYIGHGISWYKQLEATLFKLAGVQNEEVNVPLITMGGYKLSKSEGRTIHWKALNPLGCDGARMFFDDMAVDGENWEWNWEVFGKYVVACNKKQEVVQ